MKGFFLAVLFNVFCAGYEYNTKFEKEYFVSFSYTLILIILYIIKLVYLIENEYLV
jgi:hypothetical protein